jgi:UDP-3-O-[3-hydroxymyristoyl] glucosamine N-acyltransferase
MAVIKSRIYFQMIGKGGFAKEVKKCLDCCNWYEFEQINEIRKEVRAIIAIADIPTRIALTNPEQLYGNVIIGDVLGDLKMGVGNIICHCAILTTDITIGNHCQFNLLTTVGHDCKIGDYVTCAPKVSISGNCTIGNRVYIGTGAVIKEKISICDDVIIGANSFVNRDIVEPGTYAGSPAIRINYTNKSGIEYGGIEIKAKKKYL